MVRPCSPIKGNQFLSRWKKLLEEATEAAAVTSWPGSFGLDHHVVSRISNQVFLRRSPNQASLKNTVLGNGGSEGWCSLLNTCSPPEHLQRKLLFLNSALCSFCGCAELRENEEKNEEKNGGQIWAPQAGGPAGTDNVAAKPAPQEAQDLHTVLHVALETSGVLPPLSFPSNTLIPCTNSPS